MSNVQTMKLKGNDYATVPTRLKKFREENPRSDVITTPTFQADGTLIFQAKLIKDKANENSASATGHSYGKVSDDKAFEKLETVATGRALALLGYLNNGQIATSEEMEEFEDYKQTQFDEIVSDIASATKKEEFASILSNLSPEFMKEATPLINKRIKELKDAANSVPSTS